MTQHRSVWLATGDLPRYPALTEHLEVDVAVVGGGLVGLTTALLARRAGVRVAVLEAAQVGAGTTGYTTGKVTSQHSLVYADLVKRRGTDHAGRYAEANQAGTEQMASLVGELEIDCDLTRAPALVYTVDPQRISELDEEAEAARQLGLPATLTHDTDLPFPVQAAVRFDDQLHLHPGRYLAGLAQAVADAGGLLFGDTRVTDVDEQRDHTVQLSMPSATVRANQVVVATLLPPGLIGGYFAKTRPSRSYGLALRLHEPAPLSMAISADTPSRSTRPWLAPGPNGLIVVGSGHETGSDDDTEASYGDLEDWARATFPVAAVDYRWSAQDYTTADRVPYVGRSALARSTLVATGFQKWGLSNGTAAAIMLTDQLLGRDNPWSATFDATRIGDRHAVATLIKDNLKSGKELATGHLRHNGPTCTHLGCPLHWNAAERSWDCHCHGSRFGTDGSILAGPATKPLDPAKATAPDEDTVT